MVIQLCCSAWMPGGSERSSVPPPPQVVFYICLCACSLVRSPVCTGAQKHTHWHRHAWVLCVNSLRSRLFICEKTGAINPPADFGRSPARGPGRGQRCSAGDAPGAPKGLPWDPRAPSSYGSLPFSGRAGGVLCSQKQSGL